MHTALTELLGIAVPILNAPMTPQAGGALAAAVSDAGGFGMLGFDEDEGEESIAAQAAILGDRRFGIGMSAWALDARPHLLDLAIRSRPKLVSISFGDASQYVQKLHAAGILVASQVQSRAWAQTALDAGVDVLVAQGQEAGGHTGSVGTRIRRRDGGRRRRSLDRYAVSVGARKPFARRSAPPNRVERRNANDQDPRVRSPPA